MVASLPFNLLQGWKSKYLGHCRHLKISSEYSVLPLIICPKTCALRKNLLLSIKKFFGKYIPKKLQKKGKICVFFIFQLRVGTWRYWSNELKIYWYTFDYMEQLLPTIACQVSKLFFFAPPYYIILRAIEFNLGRVFFLFWSGFWVICNNV